MAYAFKGAMFEKMPVERLPRNTFDLSHQRLTTLEQGMLIPILFQPVNPADRWKVSMSDFVRMMPMFAPILHQIDISFFAFYERENQLWRTFDDFFRGGDDGNTEYNKPNIGLETFETGSPAIMSRFYNLLTMNDPYDPSDDFSPTLSPEFGQHGCLIAPGSLYDHLGLPTIDLDYHLNENGFSWEEIRDLFINSDMRAWDLAGFKMYQDIYNEYFRDEFISDKIEIFRDVDGDFLEKATRGGSLDSLEVNLYDIQELFKLRHRAWEKDRFTSALQEPVAIPKVLIPFEADVQISANTDLFSTGIYMMSPPGFTPRGSYVGLPEEGSPSLRAVTVGDDFKPQAYSDAGTSFQIETGNLVNAIQARVSNISATISQLRQRVALQEFYEQQARGGNRIKESIMINFNSVVPDYRLDRPQYLGGYKHTLSISQVLQTSSSVGSGEDYQPLGQMAGQGLSGQSGFLFNEYFPEAGYIMVIASIRPRSMYAQGMPKIMQRFNRMDYYWHKLANIGDEPIKNSEVYLDQLQSDNAIADETFGYQTRYSEYKYLANSIHGDFKTTLKDWHLARFFDKTPSLNQDFIEIDANKQGLNRIFNYTGDDYGHFLLQVQFDISCERVMEIYSVPRFS